MSLLAEIIDNLSSEKPDLTNALIKTKVLLHRLGHKELAETWVNKELNGYNAEDELPSYRILGCEPKCNWTTFAWRGDHQPLPLGNNLNDKEIFGLTHYKVAQSVATIEHTVKDSSSTGFLTITIPPGYYSKLSKAFNSDVNITNVWLEINISSMSGLLAEIRSRLLDFILELEDQFGEDATDEQIQKQANSIDTLGVFNNTILEGKNITINIGDHNLQNIDNINIEQNNIDSLAEALKNIGVGDSDILNLKAAIKADDNDDKKAIGKNVDGWYKGMLQKIIDGAWNIEIHTAASAIYDALKSYYGVS